MKNNLYVFFLFFITGLMSCSHHSGLYEHAEKIMSQHPDSVLTLLSTIQDVNDLSEKDRAMYYLLLTEAQNKTQSRPTGRLCKISASAHRPCITREICVSAARSSQLREYNSAAAVEPSIAQIDPDTEDNDEHGEVDARIDKER